MQTRVLSVALALSLLAASCGPTVRDTRAPDCYTPFQMEGSFPVTVTERYTDSAGADETTNFGMDLYVNQTGVATSYAGMLGVARETYIDLRDTEVENYFGIPLTRKTRGTVDLTGGSITIEGEWGPMDDGSTFFYTYAYTIEAQNVP